MAVQRRNPPPLAQIWLQIWLKNLHASEQDRPDVARRRTRWKQHQAKLDPARVVFVDETWAKTNMTRTHGRCARGVRLVAKVPHGHWQTLTFLAALRCDRIDAPCVIDGPINGETFHAYVAQILVPHPQTRRHCHHGQSR
jgi:DDE superfamily endonuclease